MLCYATVLCDITPCNNNTIWLAFGECVNDDKDDDNDNDRAHMKNNSMVHACKMCI